MKSAFMSLKTTSFILDPKLVAFTLVFVLLDVCLLQQIGGLWKPPDGWAFQDHLVREHDIFVSATAKAVSSFQ